MGKLPETTLEYNSWLILTRWCDSTRLIKQHLHRVLATENKLLVTNLRRKLVQLAGCYSSCFIQGLTYQLLYTLSYLLISQCNKHITVTNTRKLITSQVENELAAAAGAAAAAGTYIVDMTTARSWSQSVLVFFLFLSYFFYFFKFQKEPIWLAAHHQ